MKYNKRKAIRLLSLLVLPLSLALTADRVKSAAEFPSPCREDSYLTNLRRQGFKFPEGTGLTVLGQRGGKDNWERNWQVRLNGTAPELLKLVDAKLAEGWTKVSGTAERGGAQTLWKFSDEDGKQ